jgi:hypothetical protein
MDKSRSKAPIFFVVVLAAASVWMAIARQLVPPTPAPDLVSFGSALATLLFASAILERALDVLLSLTFGGTADQLDAEIRARKATIAAAQGTVAPVAPSAAATTPAPATPSTPPVDDQALKALVAKRIELSTTTRRSALPIAVGAGLAISSVGLRCLHPLFQKAPQDGWFTAVDIVVTGLLLAGGSDGIHWLIALYRDWIDKNRSTKS